MSNMKQSQFNFNSLLNIIQIVILVGGGVYVTAQNNQKINTALQMLEKHEVKIEVLSRQVSRMEGEMNRFMKLGE